MVTISEYLEGIIIECGGFGRFQLMMSIIILGAKLPIAWTLYAMTFAGATPDWWCGYQNDTTKEATNSIDQYKTCLADNETKCSNFTFDSSMHTIVNQFDLVCDRDWIIPCATTVQMGGILVACLLMGHLSDFIGRKPVLFFSFFMCFSMNLMAYFSVSWQMFVTIRFFLGFAVGNYLSVFYPLLTEFMSNDKRPYVAGLPSWTIPASMFGLVAYLLPNWANIHLLTSIITLPFLFSWWFIPESFRWLISNKRYHNAEEIIKKMARINKKPVPDLTKISEMSIENTQETYSVLDILRYSYLLRNTILHSVMWFTCSYVYYAIGFGVKNLSGSLYLNIFLVSAVEIPGDLFAIYTSNRLGRKWSVSIFFLWCALNSFVVGSLRTVQDQIDEDLSGKLIIAFSMIAKSAVSAGWTATYVLSSEVYPTVVRNIGFGFQNAAARIGGMVAPQMVFLAEKQPGVLFYLAGAFALTSSVCALLSSETGSHIIQDTLEPYKTKKHKDVSLNVGSPGADTALLHNPVTNGRSLQNHEDNESRV